MRTFAVATVAVLLVSAPAHASQQPVQARDLGHVCDGATTVHSVKLINRTAHSKRFDVTSELVTADLQAFEHRTYWVSADEGRVIRFRSSDERYRAWAINMPSTGDRTFRLLGTSLCA